MVGWFAAGAAVAVLGQYVWSWWRDRKSRTEGAPPPSPAETEHAAAEVPLILSGASEAGTSPLSPVVPEVPGIGWVPGENVSAVMAPPTGEGPSATSIAKAPPEFQGAVLLSERVIDHLWRQPRIGPYDIATAGMSQAGLTEALDATQSGVSKVLRRLIASGVLAESREHVQGSAIRLKVYRLTPLGETLARDLRARRRGRSPDASGSPKPPSGAWIAPRAAPPGGKGDHGTPRGRD